ncbi:hypothetical protein Acr_29g0007290 [Actinidia rufa]|uniref:Uncharacterized protein n=1 Tax=Actinidia rufa TaxID=165716 RepID=A0A7J0HEM7_9ERIC|nr:hypothetical protein Acr_29g0007290 [Actinidia rufa]
MTTKVIQLSSSPGKDFSNNEGSPYNNGGNPSMDTRPPNTMTQDELDRLRESCSFPFGIQIRLLEVDETIAATRLGEVAFVRPPFKPVFVFPSTKQLGGSWHTVTSAPPSSPLMHGEVSLARWCYGEFHTFTLSLNEFRNLFGLFNNSKPDFGWLYFKDVLLSKSFLRSFALDSRKIMSSGKDNAEDKSTSNAAHVASDEGESCIFQDDPSKVRNKVAQVQARKPGQIQGSPSSSNRMDKKNGLTAKAPTRSKAMSSRATSKAAAPSAVPGEGTSDKIGEAVEWAASKFFDKGFDLCKKKIVRLYPELDIQDLQINA